MKDQNDTITNKSVQYHYTAPGGVRYLVSLLDSGFKESGPVFMITRFNDKLQISGTKQIPLRDLVLNMVKA